MGPAEEVAEGSVWVCCGVGRWRDGGQRAGFRVDRSGGLYQNNTFVDYMTKRRSDKERTCFQREYLHRLTPSYERPLRDEGSNLQRTAAAHFKDVQEMMDYFRKVMSSSH